MIKHKQLSAQDWNTIANCPEQVENRKHITCYQCYEFNRHMSPNGLAKLNNINLVLRNYAKLTDKQKPLVPSDSYNLAKQYLSMKRDLKTNARSGGEKLQNDLKN